MSLFQRLPRVARWLGRGPEAAGVSPEGAERVAEFRRRRAAVVAIIIDSSLSPRLKASMVQTAAQCARLEELSERVTDVFVYHMDLWDCGGEDGSELSRVATRVQLIAVIGFLADSSLSSACKQRLIAAVGEGADAVGWRERVMAMLAGSDVAGEDAAEIRRLAQRISALS